MELVELLGLVSGVLEKQQIPYLVTGSVATIVYGEPRLTNDIDLVVRLQPEQVASLCAAFPGDEFYVSPEAALDAVHSAGQFNILHPGSGLKIDVMVADDSPFNTSRFGRSRMLQVAPETSPSFASPEPTARHLTPDPRRPPPTSSLTRHAAPASRSPPKPRYFRADKETGSRRSRSLAAIPWADAGATGRGSG